ncbi:MAG: hypothetical protein OXN96_06825 [Bryobacterales bacterium]|nr:hypothetical protein [Bryobacterales bacterium]
MALRLPLRLPSQLAWAVDYDCPTPDTRGRQQSTNVTERVLCMRPVLEQILRGFGREAAQVAIREHTAGRRERTTGVHEYARNCQIA